MSAYEIIARKRDGHQLSEPDIRGFIEDFMQGGVTDYQMTALLMAIYLKGMTAEETVALTRAYIDSGIRLDLSDLPGVMVDKHSTGGVGDKVSIILAPLVACLGVSVPMISGRGLGHSGGTLDKLESIPGFRTALSLPEFRQTLRAHGLALIGQTADLVPADKRIYALRDVTATVDCIPLICASIMSKKIAEGATGLVLDVKYGSGAFMKQLSDAEALAQGLIAIGEAFGQQVIASITSMEQPLGYKIGNWLEIEECLDCLNGGGPADLLEVTLNLAGHMLRMGRPELDAESAQRECRAALQDGRAMQRLLEVTAAQDGDIRLLEQPQRYPQAPCREVLTAGRDGFVTAMETFQIGMASVGLGAGRLRAEDAVDPLAGIILFKKTGDAVRLGEPLLEMRSSKTGHIDTVRQQLRQAISIGDAPPASSPLIVKEIGNDQ